MKNSKILPFGDWFKVYEKAGMNFKKSQQLLESKIFEDKKTVDLPMPGKDLKSSIWLQLAEIKFKETYTNMLTAINANKSNPNVQASIDEMKKLRATDRDLFSSYTSGVNSPEQMLALFAAAWAKNIGENSKWMIKFRLLTGPIEVDRNSEQDIKLTPSHNGAMYTIGQVDGNSATSIDKEGKDSVSGYQNLKKYINNFNLAHFTAGSDSYNHKSVSEKGFFDFGKAEGTVSGAMSMYASSIYEGGSVERSEEEQFELVGAETAQVGQAAIKFKEATLEQGGAEIPATEMPKVEALAKTIMEKFAGKTIAGFELLSSASPNYGSIANKPGWESNYPNGTTNVGDPGAGTDDASKNAKLAYERGVSFMKALNAKLNEMGHPGFADYKVKWQIATQGGPEGSGGRFVDLQISTNEKKGTVEKKTDVTGKPLTTAKTTSGVKEATLYCYAISF